MARRLVNDHIAPGLLTIRDVTMLTWALAVMGLESRDLLEAIAEDCCDRLAVLRKQDGDPNGLTTLQFMSSPQAVEVLWSFAALGFRHERYMQAMTWTFADDYIAQLTEFHMAKMIVSWSNLNYYPRRLVMKLTRWFRDDEIRARCSPVVLDMVLAGLAAMNHNPGDEFLMHWGKAILRRYNQFKPQELVRIVTSMSILGFTHTIQGVVAIRAPEFIPELGGEDVLQLADIYAEYEDEVPEYVDMKKFFEAIGDRLAPLVVDLDKQQLLTAMRGIIRHGIMTEKLEDGLEEWLNRHMLELDFSPSIVVVLLGWLQVVPLSGERTSNRLMSTLANAVAYNMQKLSGNEIRLIMRGFAQLGYTPGDTLVVALMKEAENKYTEFSLYQLTDLLYSHVRLQSPGDSLELTSWLEWLLECSTGKYSRSALTGRVRISVEQPLL